MYLNEAYRKIDHTQLSFLVSLGAQQAQHIDHDAMWTKKVKKKLIMRRMPMPRGLLVKMF